MNWPFRAHFLWRDTLLRLGTRRALVLRQGGVPNFLTLHGKPYPLWVWMESGVGWKVEGSEEGGNLELDFYAKYKKIVLKIKKMEKC